MIYSIVTGIILASDIPGVDPTQDAPLYDKFRHVLSSFGGLIVLGLVALFLWGAFTLAKGLAGEHSGGWGRGAVMMLGSAFMIWIVFNNAPVLNQFQSYLGK